MTNATAIRFWSKVDQSDGPDSCWLWVAGCSPDGYGAFGISNKGGGATPWRRVRAHRFAWTLLNGPIPDGLCICHNCDTPRCVNPSHLFIGTHADNVADKVAKGRARGGSPPGEANPRAKLSSADVLEMRDLYEAGSMSQAAIGSIYGVCQAHVSDVVRRQIWTHI